MFLRPTPWKFCKAMFQGIRQFENGEMLQGFATIAHKHCCKWFGEPDDHEWSVQLVRWPRSACVRTAAARMYVLTIDDQRGTETTLGTVAHEMCHRVTDHSGPLINQMWISEMLACAVSSEILRKEGVIDYAQACDRAYEPLPRIDVLKLRALRRVANGPVFADTGPSYPPGFGADIRRLGNAFVVASGWDSFVLLAGAESLESWIACLPNHRQPAIKSILGECTVTLDAHTVPEDVRFEYFRDYGQALFWIGDFENAITALEMANRQNDCDMATHLYLGKALWRADKQVEAEAMLNDAVRRWPESPDVHHAIADFSWQQGCFDTAGEHYRAITQINPADTFAFYNLAYTHYKRDRLDEALAILEPLSRQDGRAITAPARSLLASTRHHRDELRAAKLVPRAVPRAGRALSE